MKRLINKIMLSKSIFEINFEFWKTHFAEVWDKIIKQNVGAYTTLEVNLIMLKLRAIKSQHK